MAEILVVVDMQNDFVSGVLGTQEAFDIVPNVVGPGGGRPQPGRDRAVHPGHS